MAVQQNRTNVEANFEAVFRGFKVSLAGSETGCPTTTARIPQAVSKDKNYVFLGQNITEVNKD